MSKGAIGEAASNLLGSLIVSHLQRLTMARSDIAEQERVPFFVHVDELANFTTDSFASLLSEARKYGTHFAVAAQYTSQASDHLLDALLGNVGTLIVFRVSASDAELLAPEFHPLPVHELADQAPYRAWIRRVDTGQHPIEIHPPLYPSRQARGRVIATSRRKFGRPRSIIERDFV